ncbi:hypothetical protein L6V77_14940 [Myxococcota bacterium]|nr:hypothetical protein [Myxococcota bacterium]
MKPQALVDGILVETDGARVILTRADGERFSLPAVMAAVWRAADGRTDVAGLVAAARTVDPAADTQMVWAAIDALTDDGLMRRVAPPAAGLDRRMALRGLAAAAAAVVAVPAIARAEAAAAPAADKLKSSTKNEQQTKDYIKSRLGASEAEEQKAKEDLQAAEVRAKEEEAKVAKAQPADVAARKRSEEEAKVQVTALRKKADAAKEQVMKASEETEKKAPAR